MAVEKKQVSSQVNKESSEVFEALGSLGEAVIVKARGGLTLAEIIEVVSANIGALIAASTGAEKLGEEFQDSAEDSLLPAALMAQKIAKALRAPAPTV